jgi:uncharacterized delta-60 repeat protein
MKRNRTKPSSFGKLFEPLEKREMFSAGSLDPNFGFNGQTALSNLTVSSADVAVQASGKTVAVGTDNSGDFVLARTFFDGSPDITFGTHKNGLVFTTIPNGTHNNHATAIGIQPDQSIDVLGYSNGPSPGLIIARYSYTSGALDTTFGTNGFVTSMLGDGVKSVVANDLAIENNGRMVVAGTAVIGPDHLSEMFVARFNPNGTPDAFFGDKGHVFISMGGHAFGQSLALDQLGTPATNPYFGMIAVVGRSFDVATSRNEMAIARLTAQGNLINGFGANGNGSTTFIPDKNEQSVATGVAFQNGGKIVVSGSVDTNDPTAEQSDMVLVRFTPAGVADTTFGTNGITRTHIQGYDQANDLLVSNDGGLIVGGSSATSDTTPSRFAVVRYTANGVLDTTFGTSGVQLAGFDSYLINSSSIARLARGPGNLFVATGGIGFPVARYLDALNASEAGPQSATFVVRRTTTLSQPQRVYFSIGGTATPPSLFAIKNHINDYTLTGMTVPLVAAIGSSTTPYVDIPAGSAFTAVTVTPINDGIIEGTETATFTRLNDPAGITPFNATVTIKDNKLILPPHPPIGTTIGATSTNAAAPMALVAGTTTTSGSTTTTSGTTATAAVNSGTLSADLILQAKKRKRKAF